MRVAKLKFSFFTNLAKETLLNIWQETNSTKIWVCFKSKCQSNDEEFTIQFNEWTNFKIEHVPIAFSLESKSLYQIWIDEETVYKKRFPPDQIYRDITTYASTDYAVPAKGLIKSYSFDQEKVRNIISNNN